jgi:sulfofructose kinase
MNDVTPSAATVVCVGHCNLDYIVSTAEIPKEPIKFRADDWREIGGGLAATASVAVARLGGRAVFCGRVGDDDVGLAIRAGLEAENVDTTWLRTVSARSPRSMVLVDAHGERLLAAYYDPNFPHDADWLLPKLEGALLTDLTWPRGALRALEEARRLGVPAVVDADATTRTSPEDAHAVLSRSTHPIFSRGGLRQHSGESEILAGLRAMRERHRTYVGVTDGEHGYYWLEGDSLEHLAAPRVETVDTNGAGDAFHGAFALSLARGESEREAARFATLVASLKCTRPGGRAGIPTSNEVAAFAATLDRTSV